MTTNDGIYTVKVAAEIARRYTEWTRVADLKVDWFRVVLGEDGTAEVWLSVGDQPPTAEKESA